MNKPLEQDSPDTRQPMPDSVEPVEPVLFESEDGGEKDIPGQASQEALPDHIPAEHPEKAAKRPRRYF